MFYNFIKYFVLFLMKVVYRHKIYGKAHVPEGGGILASNHISYLDPPILGISTPGKIHFLARGTLFNFAPLGWLIRKLNTHPVVQGKDNLSTFKLTVELILDGKKVLIFPEGRRSKDGTISQGQAGVGMLVMRTCCQVIPVYVHGTYNVWPKGRNFPKLWGHTACVYGRPLDFSKIEVGESKKERQRKIVEEIMEAISALRTWYLNGHQGDPP